MANTETAAVTADNRENNTSKARRIEAIDIARGVALLAMASYHFIWDLEMFGYAAQGTAATGWPKLYARGIASSFLFLVGLSLVLAHQARFEPAKFGRRLATIVAAAALVSIGTYFAFPHAFIFYGILHSIAVSSIVALAFLHLPALITLTIGIAVIALPNYFNTPVFDADWLVWTGLSERIPRSLDFVPFFPWFGPVLLGVAAGDLAKQFGILNYLADLPKTPATISRPISFISRHSLAFYLVHQPILIALIWAFSQVAPADGTLAYLGSCQKSCEERQDAVMCKRFCMCTAESLKKEDLLSNLQSGTIRPAENPQMLEIARICTRKAEGTN